MRIPALVGAAAPLVLLLGACAEPTATTSAPAAPSSAATPPAPTASAKQTAALRRVAADQVCMMNNRFMGTAQIPVEIGGKTYFGCCAMCKGRLESDPTARTGRDPVSGNPVDKASAVIGARADNTVVYFENEQNLATYPGT